MSCCDCTCFIYGSFYRICQYDLLLQGDALLGDALSLTNPNKEPPSHGRVLYDRKIHFSDEGRQAIFETTITFKMCGNICGCPTLCDGITFFIVPANHHFKKDGVYNDVDKDDAQIFAVEFDISRADTVSVPPDGTGTPVTDATSVPRIEINVGKEKSKAKVDAKDIVGKKVTATITYRERKVTVVAVVGTEVYSLSYEVDLKKVLPEYVQVGIAGWAGMVGDGRCVFSWSFASALIHDNYCCC